MKIPTIQFHEGDTEVYPEELAEALNQLLPSDLDAYFESLIANAHPIVLRSLRNALDNA